MMAPGLIVLFVFAYLPMFGIIIAFKDYRAYQGVLGSRWVGLKNFYYLFETDDARRIVFNTLFMNALFIVRSSTTSSSPFSTPATASSTTR